MKRKNWIIALAKKGKAEKDRVKVFFIYIIRGAWSSLDVTEEEFIMRLAILLLQIREYLRPILSPIS